VEKARSWPETLGAGRPYDVDERLEDFIEQLNRENLGQKEKVNVLLNKLIEETKQYAEKSDPYQVLGILALQKHGNINQALTQVQKWLQNEPDNVLAQWAYAFLSGKIGAASEIMQQWGSDDEPNVLRSTLRVYSDINKTIYPLEKGD